MIMPFTASKSTASARLENVNSPVRQSINLLTFDSYSVSFAGSSRPPLKMAVGVTPLTVLCIIVATAVNAQNESCPFGADYAGRTREDITVYQNEPTSTNCNIDLDWIRSNSKGWTHFAALPKYPKDSREGYQGGMTKMHPTSMITSTLLAEYHS